MKYLNLLSTATASLFLVSNSVGASTFIGNGGTIDVMDVEVGSSITLNDVYFALGDISRDEAMNFFNGPNIELVSGTLSAFNFQNVNCIQFGIGLDCTSQVVFTPTSGDDFLSVFDISALFNFTETHGQDAGTVYEYSDSFQVTFSGTGIAPVPLPAGLPLLLAGLGVLGLAKRYRPN